MSKKELKKNLNLGFLDLINRTYVVGEKELLHVDSPDDVDLDFLALYSHLNEYNKTKKTAVCFYEYDRKFDNKNGIYDSIKNEDTIHLNKFKKRFENVDVFIAPDYSQYGNGLLTDNLDSIQKARKVSLWLIFECNKKVIPNITYSNEESLEYFLDGLEKSKVVAISLKGILNDNEELELLNKAIDKMLEKLIYLKKIFVYTSSISNDKIFVIFKKVIEKGIEVIIPENTLRNRNIILSNISKSKMINSDEDNEY